MILTVTLALILEVKTEFNLGRSYLNRYTETRAPWSHSRLARCKPGLGWKLSNFCSNIWLYICQKANRVYAAGWSTGGRHGFAASLLHTMCGHIQQLHRAAAALMAKTTLFSEKSFRHPGVHHSTSLALSSEYSCGFFKITGTDEAFEKKYALLFSRCNSSGMELHQNRYTASRGKLTCA